MGQQKTPAVKQKKAAYSANSRSFTKVSSGQTDLSGSFIQFSIPVEPDPTVGPILSQSSQVFKQKSYLEAQK